MATSISWKLNVSIPSGPSLALSSAISVDAYDRIAVTVPAAAAPVEVEVDVQPGAVGRVLFLVVRSDVYGDNLKYKVHATGNPEQNAERHFGTGGSGKLGPAGSASRQTHLHQYPWPRRESGDPRRAPGRLTVVRHRRRTDPCQ
jgi:hypothetical protein